MKSFSIPLKVSGEGKNAEKRFEMKALIDSGAQGKFLNKDFALRNKIALNKLNSPITVYNVDSTKNNSGKIEYSTWLKVKVDDKEMNTRFLVTDIGKEDMILGLPWLKQYNPVIDWDKGTMDISNVKLSKTFGEVLQRSIELSRMEILPWTPETEPPHIAYFNALVEEVNMTTELLLAKLAKPTPEPIENLDILVPNLNEPSLESTIEEIIDQIKPANINDNPTLSDNDIDTSFLYDDMPNLEPADEDHEHTDAE